MRRLLPFLILGPLGLVSFSVGAEPDRTAAERAPRLGTLTCNATGCYGDADGPGSLLIPLDVAADSSGNVYVLDHDAGCVLKYAPGGGYLDRIGRRGEGPGEMRRPRNLVATDGGRIVVFDLGPRRFDLFTTGGEFLGTRDHQGDVRALQAAADGVLAGVFRYPGRGWIETGMKHRVVLFPVDAEPSAIDSMRIFSHQVIQRTQETSTNVARPFAPGLHVVALPSGWIVSAHGDRYRLEWVRPDRSGRFALRRAVEPVVVVDDDRERVLAAEIAESPRFADALRARLEFPREKPAIAGLAAGPNGELLVLRPAAPDEFLCDVYSGQGEFLGTIGGSRPGGRLRFVRGALFAMGEIDDAELPRVTRYALGIAWNDPD